MTAHQWQSKKVMCKRMLQHNIFGMHNVPSVAILTVCFIITPISDNNNEASQTALFYCPHHALHTKALFLPVVSDTEIAVKGK
jgi:hypothetical protein